MEIVREYVNKYSTLKEASIAMKPLKAMDKVWMAILGAIGGGIGLAVLKKMEF